MLVVQCKNCEHCKSDMISTDHGGWVKVCYCEEHEYIVIDPYIERECEDFEIKC